MTPITEATAGYEAWLADALKAPLDPADLRRKHLLLADPRDPFPFFRGTYYRWAQWWAQSAGPLADAPPVLAVGDLHVENYGTWRDADGRLCWGVNDFDEADDLPYTHDLVRLAASVRFAKKAGSLGVGLSEACAAILEGYTRSLKDGGRPFVLEERHPHLRAVAVTSDRDPVAFWAKTTKLLTDPPADLPPDARTALQDDLPAKELVVHYRFRPGAGVGSLGRRRFVALAEWAGGWVCREAKATAPPATAWANGTASPNRLAAVAGRAVRAFDPFYRVVGGWVIRRLGPHSARIDLTQLAGGNVQRIVRAMGAELGNVHLGTARAAVPIVDDLRRRPDGWLADAAKAFAELLTQDWTAWRQASPK